MLCHGKAGVLCSVRGPFRCSPAADLPCDLVNFERGGFMLARNWHKGIPDGGADLMQHSKW